MAEPFLGEIRMFSFYFAPTGWSTCDGQTMQVSQNSALYSLLGQTYGGNGSTTFNLPDLRGRTTLQRSATYLEGAAGGSETSVLTATSQLPAHTHVLTANSAAGGANTPQGNVPAAVQDSTNTLFAYAATKASPAATLAAGTLSATGGAGHNNMQPSLTINYCIALSGYYPSRS